MDEQTARRYRFEGFQLDARTRELRDARGEAVPLNARAFDALCLLLRHRDRVVGKDELLDTVWSGRVVEENTLTQAISILRKALGSGAGDHRYIVTVPGRGYRFVADVEQADAEPSRDRRADDRAPVEESMAPAMAYSRGADARRWWLLALLLSSAIVALLAWRARSPQPAPAAQAAQAAMPAARTVTLAVLPFRALAGGVDDPGLALGMADTLITRLSRSPSLRVPTLAAVDASVLQGMSAVEAARELGVTYVVEGTTQRAGSQVRVNARLLTAEDGAVVWSETFDAPLAGVFTLQDQIGRAVAAALSLPVPQPTARGDSPCDGGDAAAYRAYLRGYHQLHRPNRSRMQQALADFREAIDRDPTCARAWAGIANAYRATVMTADGDPRELFPLAKAATEKALAIDPELAEGWSSKGFIEFWYDWDWPRAEASLRHAIELNPNLAEAQIALAHLLANIGRREEAAPFARRAAELDPFSPLFNSLAASFVNAGGAGGEAQARLQRILDLQPEAWVALRVRAGRAMRSKDFASAVRDLERARALSEDSSQILNMLPRAYLGAGDRAAAERVLAELETRRREGYLPATSLAAARLALGDGAGALDLLEQGYVERDVRMTFLAIDPWADLRREPRFQALLRQMRLPVLGGATPRGEPRS